jgi:structural maintenance of chromosome 1
MVLRCNSQRAHTAGGLQMIVISLKESFYNKADALVGVYRDQDKESSGHLTLDLQKVVEVDDEEEEKGDT